MALDPPDVPPPLHHTPSQCAAFRAAMKVLGKPWNGMLLRELEAGSLRFSALAERLAPIGDRMLSLRLKELEAAGLVSREVEPGPPVRVSYALTPAGRGIGEVTQAVTGWGHQVLEAAKGEAVPEGS
jgi:DNA-binding HxlR family transcriptional regulator